MRVLFILLLLFVSSQVSAKQLVLIQGYLGSSKSWSEAGITRQLHQQGWRYSGEYYYGSNGVALFEPQIARLNMSDSAHRFYQVNLPTEASIQHQAYYLTAYLKQIRKRFPQQELILVGHSAGGVLARYVMVRSPQLNVARLITIASPHLGTDSAEFGKLVGESPIALLAPMIGAGTLNRSQALYNDLLPELPHRFLYWLNRQPHPQAEYISIVRDHQSPQGGDFIVPEHSQYLENVASLKYRASSFIVKGSHALSAKDGRLLLDLINERVLKAI